MDAELVVLNVQEPIRAGRKRLAAPGYGGVLPLRDMDADARRAGERFPRYVHAVRSRPRGPDQADDRALPDGLQLDVLAEIDLAFVLHFQVHILSPLKKLRHLAVFPRLGELPPRHREYAEISAPQLLPDFLLQNAVADSLIVHALQEFFQGDPSPAVFRREQARIGAHPVA